MCWSFGVFLLGADFILSLMRHHGTLFLVLHLIREVFWKVSFSLDGTCPTAVLSLVIRKSYSIGLKPVLLKILGICLTRGEIDNFTRGEAYEVRLMLTSRLSDSSLLDIFCFIGSTQLFSFWADETYSNFLLVL